MIASGFITKIGVNITGRGERDTKSAITASIIFGSTKG